MADPSRYCTYVLRGWFEEGEVEGARGVWRFRLRDVQTGEQRGFAGVEELTRFLLQRFGQDDPDASP